MSVSFIDFFYRGIGIPEKFLPEMLSYAEKFDASPEWHILVQRVMTHDYTNFGDILDAATAIGEKFQCHRFTTHHLLFAFCGEPLLEKYKVKGIDEEIYWQSMRDLRWKFNECLAVHGIPGTFVASWYPGFFDMTRFALGRLQYEHYRFDADEYTRASVTLHRGDPVINFHIPSCGPLTLESRMDSYKRAYEFYRKDFPSGILPLVCHSWLLYPGHREFLPPESNILSFMNDFDILRFDERDREHFGDAWRVFGAAASKSPEEWPRDTSIRRALADRICSGGKVGVGYGVILFDGEKIIR